MLFKLSKKQKKALSQYLTILHSRYERDVSRVILYGSVVQNKSDLESDIDLLIVISKGGQKFRDEISMACFDIILETNIILSPLVMNEEIYEWHRNYHDPLYNNIQKNGIDIWIKKPKFL